MKGKKETDYKDFLDDSELLALWEQFGGSPSSVNNEQSQVHKEMVFPDWCGGTGMKHHRPTSLMLLWMKRSKSLQPGSKIWQKHDMLLTITYG